MKQCENCHRLLGELAGLCKRYSESPAHEPVPFEREVPVDSFIGEIMARYPGLRRESIDRILSTNPHPIEGDYEHAWLEDMGRDGQ